MGMGVWVLGSTHVWRCGFWVNRVQYPSSELWVLGNTRFSGYGFRVPAGTQLQIRPQNAKIPLNCKKIARMRPLSPPEKGRSLPPLRLNPSSPRARRRRGKTKVKGPKTQDKRTHSHNHTHTSAAHQNMLRVTSITIVGLGLGL